MPVALQSRLEKLATSTDVTVGSTAYRAESRGPYRRTPATP